MVIKKIFLTLFGFVILTSFVFASPVLTIHSPQPTEYNSTKVLLNVTTGGPADLFFKDVVTGKHRLILQNTTSIESYLYINEGNHKFTIWANDSTGETNSTVYFNSVAHNPVNITSCGILRSSDTAYVLNNDIMTPSGGQGSCIYADGTRNSTIDLNGYTISAGTANPRADHAMDLYASNVELFNGTLNGSSSDLNFLLTIQLNKGRIYNMIFQGSLGIWVFQLNDVIIENVTFNNSVGIWNLGTKNTHIINSSFSWNGFGGTESTGCLSSAICDWSGYSELFLENTTINSFPNQDFYLRGVFSDYYLRNSNINSSSINYPSWPSDARIFTQHLILIDVTDQFNERGSGVVEVLDNGLFPRETEGDVIIKTLSNPTSNLLVSTDNRGKASVWLTENLIYAKSSSSAVISRHDFSNYTLKARSWNSSAERPLNLTGHHSTIPISFNIVVPKDLPICTISQMLDLNNDGLVNILDAVIILREISGLSVSEQVESKECEGINLNPF